MRKDFNQLIKDQILWRAEQKDNAPELSLFDFFSAGSVHQIFSDLGVSHHVICVPLLIARSQIVKNKSSKLFIFIGEECFPSIFFLRDCFLETGNFSLNNFIFVHAKSEKSKIYALETSLLSTNVACILAAVNTISFFKSRKISLQARKNGSLCFLFPSRDISDHATALKGKWKLTTKETNDFLSHWTIDLLYLKGPKTLKTSWELGITHDKEVSIDLLP